MRDRLRGALHLISHRVDGTPIVRQFQAEDDIGAGHQLLAPRGLVERVQTREVHPAVIVNHRRLQCFREHDHLFQTNLRMHGAVHNDDRILRLYKEPRGLGDSPCVAQRRCDRVELRNLEPGAIANRVLLKFLGGD